MIALELRQQEITSDTYQPYDIEDEENDFDDRTATTDHYYN